jgi:hypothetical protein
MRSLSFPARCDRVRDRAMAWGRSLLLGGFSLAALALAGPAASADSAGGRVLEATCALRRCGYPHRCADPGLSGGQVSAEPTTVITDISITWLVSGYLSSSPLTPATESGLVLVFFVVGRQRNGRERPSRTSYSQALHPLQSEIRSSISPRGGRFPPGAGSKTR